MMYGFLYLYYFFNFKFILQVFIHFANQQCDQFELRNNGSQLSLSSAGIELTQLPDIVSENTPLTSPSRPLEDNTVFKLQYLCCVHHVLLAGCIF